MTFGAAAAAIILMYLTRKFPWLAALLMLLCLGVTGGIFYYVWSFSYPDNLWYFWMLVGIGVGYWMFLWLFGKAVDDLIER
jgi:hypothetical protein